MKISKLFFVIASIFILLGAFLEIKHFNHSNIITLSGALLGAIACLLFFLEKKKEIS